MLDGKPLEKCSMDELLDALGRLFEEARSLSQRVAQQNEVAQEIVRRTEGRGPRRFGPAA
jgi:hypothetical protein